MTPCARSSPGTPPACSGSGRRRPGRAVRVREGTDRPGRAAIAPASLLEAHAPHVRDLVLSAHRGAACREDIAVVLPGREHDVRIPEQPEMPRIPAPPDDRVPVDAV